MNLIIHTFILINFALVYGSSYSDLCRKFNDVSPVYLPDEDCRKFYQCSNGIAYRFDCPTGLHFNVKFNVCDWPTSAGCEQRKTTKKPTTELTTTKVASTESETTATTEVPCRTTVSTEETLSTTAATITTTPVSSYETTLSTEAPTSTDKTASTTITAVPSTTATRVPSDETTLSTETASLLTDVTTLTTITEISSTLSTLTTAETSTPSEFSAETTIDGTTKVPNNQRSTTLETTTVLTDVCSRQPDKSFLAPDSNDCTKYLYCNYGTVQIMNCPNGRYFNPVMLICTLPSQAECYIEFNL